MYFVVDVTITRYVIDEFVVIIPYGEITIFNKINNSYNNNVV